jgi:hypothetical protein
MAHGSAGTSSGAPWVLLHMDQGRAIEWEAIAGGEHRAGSLVGTGSRGMPRLDRPPPLTLPRPPQRALAVARPQGGAFSGSVALDHKSFTDAEGMPVTAQHSAKTTKQEKGTFQARAGRSVLWHARY